MPASLDTFVSDGRVVITFPEAAIPAREREEFIAFLKTEWSARQSQLAEESATALAEEVDRGWWEANRARILSRIGE